ncbi:aminodeoxychorismate synthase component I [Fimbriiglobus ruber]|uniref:aminodeoxychorismate synthase n=1 Tax=Fimbriiglobus ruber TaxID=1908690 RepID=A0A225DTT6_9BACT|nr:aminodeoxychorismate synthase component I [Fimbriiglobus ruber]OWK40599.1 Para-aminobenzoate synthase, aminase component [Fimbriiglobus ruber]
MSASAPHVTEPHPVPPLVEELIPCPDPWDVARRLAHLPRLLFLDSADRHPERGRYSYVMADPVEWHGGGGQRFGVGTVFDNLSRSFDNFRRAPHPDLPPFQGGLGFVLGYELNRQTEERVPAPRNDEFGLDPVGGLSAAGLYDWVVSFDHKQQRAWLVVHGRPELDRSPKRRIAIEKLNEIRAALRRGRQPLKHVPTRSPLQATLVPQHPLPGFPGVTSNFSRAGYLAAVRRAIEYVHAGDCFQVNLSQRLLAPLAEHPLELYGRLRATNPAPFACYFDAGDFQVVSASPERFLKLTDGGVVTQPIKGTRPRGTTPEADAANIRELTTNLKDRAENVMIVDLLRNDLGRVCEYGSVVVPKVCAVETYRYVHHLVSEVRGRLRDHLGPFDLLRAAFPGGSVTGAPKVRAMEIIAELEPTARGPYCGSVGFVGFDGAMDTNILIRTFTAGRGYVQFPVGGGIVADSDPEREYEETLHKAAGLLKSLKLATDEYG